MKTLGRKLELLRQYGNKMLKDGKAEANIFKLVISLFIIAVLVAALVPNAITSLFAVNTSTWDAGTVATYGAIPILVVVCVIAILAGLAYRAFND